MAKSNKKIYIGITIITLAVIAVVIVYYLQVVKPSREAGNDLDFEKQIAIESSKPPVASSGGSPSTPSKSVIGNDTVLKVTNPLMKADRIQWVQYLNNKYAKAKKAKDPKSDIVILTEDGVYGEKTKAAVNRLMGKTSTTWTEFSARVNGFLEALK